MSLREKIASGIRDRHSEFAFGVAKEPPYEREDGGIPPEMWDGEPDIQGWVSWKLVTSTISEQDLANLETTFGSHIPSEIREYLLVPFFHVVEEISDGENSFMLPAMPSDNPFAAFSQLVMGWKPLIPFGYFPFAEFRDSWGPVCLKESDGSVLWFDHEQMVVEPSEVTQAFLLEREKPLYDSVESFWDAVFGSTEA